MVLAPRPPATMTHDSSGSSSALTRHLHRRAMEEFDRIQAHRVQMHGKFATEESRQRNALEGEEIWARQHVVSDLWIALWGHYTTQRRTVEDAEETDRWEILAKSEDTSRREVNCAFRQGIVIVEALHDGYDALCREQCCAVAEMGCDIDVQLLHIRVAPCQRAWRSYMARRIIRVRQMDVEFCHVARHTQERSAIEQEENTIRCHQCEVFTLCREAFATRQHVLNVVETGSRDHLAALASLQRLSVLSHDETKWRGIICGEWCTGLLEVVSDTYRQLWGAVLVFHKSLERFPGGAACVRHGAWKVLTSLDTISQWWRDVQQLRVGRAATVRYLRLHLPPRTTTRDLCKTKSLVQKRRHVLRKDKERAVNGLSRAAQELHEMFEVYKAHADTEQSLHRRRVEEEESWMWESIASQSALDRTLVDHQQRYRMEVLSQAQRYHTIHERDQWMECQQLLWEEMYHRAELERTTDVVREIAFLETKVAVRHTAVLRLQRFARRSYPRGVGKGRALPQTISEPVSMTELVERESLEQAARHEYQTCVALWHRDCALLRVVFLKREESDRRTIADMQTATWVGEIYDTKTK